MAETDLHARSMHERNHLYKCGLLKGLGPRPLTPEWPMLRFGVEVGGQVLIPNQQSNHG